MPPDVLCPGPAIAPVRVVKKLRRKLWDDAADPRYIVTEPRVGYRMAVGEDVAGPPDQ